MKEGYHKHDGYSRAHPIGQLHSDILHHTDEDLEISYQRVMDIYKAQDVFNQNFSQAEEVLNMLDILQKEVDTIELLSELDELISLMMVEGVEMPSHNEERQEVIDGDHHDGISEPNPASGLP